VTNHIPRHCGSVTISEHVGMADVDMTDAPGPSSKKAAADGDVAKNDGKKRFEVKKVGGISGTLCCATLSMADYFPVECCRPLGVGHCGGQLRHLPESHYGSL